MKVVHSGREINQLENEFKFVIKSLNDQISKKANENKDLTEKIKQLNTEIAKYKSNSHNSNQSTTTTTNIVTTEMSNVSADKEADYEQKLTVRLYFVVMVYLLLQMKDEQLRQKDIEIERLK